MVTVPTSHNTPFEKEIEMVAAEAKKYQLRRLHDASNGVAIVIRIAVPLVHHLFYSKSEIY